MLRDVKESVVFNGQAGAEYFADLPGSMVHSGDSQHYAYVAETTGIKGVERKLLVVDGK